jgi:putative transposase
MSECLLPLLSLTEEERQSLETIAHSRKAEARMVQRALVLLKAAQTNILADVARAARVSSKTAKTWIRRFQHDQRPIEERLCDEPRSGAPPRFSAEAFC